MELKNSRVKILLSAYACEPNRGSEPGVGWNWAIHLAKEFEVYVITRSNNKEVIDKYLSNNKIEHLHFYYHDCSSNIRKIKHLPYGIFVYYKKWQNEILHVAEKIVSTQKIDIVHHITFNEFRTPGKLYNINKPFVWGPIGGGQFYNNRFYNAYFSKMDVFQERIRNLINYYYLGCSADFHKAVKNAAAILIADPSTERIMPVSHKYIRLLETAYNIERNPIKNYDEGFKENIKLLWVGGIWPRKGLKLLIDALGRSTFSNFELVVIGEGKDKKKCQKLTQSYGIADKVHFLGALTYNEVNAHYDHADVFVFTSIRDTSGNVVLEAMSHGTPVIALRHHGVGEIVTEETGTLIEVSSYEQIQKDFIYAIEDYNNNYKKIVTHGKAARKRIEDVYSWENNINTISQIYQEILDRSR